MSDHIMIRRADVNEILDLRWRILRAGLPREAAKFEGDDEPTARHFAAVLDGRVIGCLTMLRRDWNNQPAWQLRGMAIDPIHQGSGIGRRLLETVESMARQEPHSLQLWCNARAPVAGFYRKAGWETVGDQFEIPTAGPHFKMTKLLAP